MNIFKKLFGPPTGREKGGALVIHLDADLKKSIQTKDQTVKDYEQENNFDQDQFLYLMALNRKTNQLQLKRKLNGFQKLSDCLAASEQHRIFVVVGYSSERSTIPRITSQMSLTDNLKFIRSGTLSKYNETKNSFEQCQLKLHHDYLTFYKFKETEKKVSFMPLQNSLVEIVNEKKNMFTVKDKFNNIIFKTTSKQDMYSWLIAITEAVKIRNSQIYMNDMDDKLAKAIRSRLDNYISKCSNLKDHSRIIPIDDIGRKALKAYFRRTPLASPLDAKLLSVIQAYLYMCKCRRQKGEAYSEEILSQIRASMRQMESEFPTEVQVRDLSSKNEFVKTIQEIMKYLDAKYRKEIIEKKNIHAVFQNYLLQQYKQDRKIPLKTLFGADPQ